MSTEMYCPNRLASKRDRHDAVLVCAARKKQTGFS
jgi:hypothetical protein